MRATTAVAVDKPVVPGRDSYRPLYRKRNEHPHKHIITAILAKLASFGSTAAAHQKEAVESNAVKPHPTPPNPPARPRRAPAEVQTLQLP